MPEQETVQAIDQSVTDAPSSSSTALEGAAPPFASESPPPIAEARRYRKRAQAAEKAAADLRFELQQKADQLAERERTIAALERRQRIDELLLDARAIDLDSARLLTETAMADAAEPDPEAAVAELRRRKPFLFRAGRSASGALSPHTALDGQQSAAVSAERAAVEAHATGHRRDLLRYLRLRRAR